MTPPDDSVIANELALAGRGRPGRTGVAAPEISTGRRQGTGLVPPDQGCPWRIAANRASGVMLRKPSDGRKSCGRRALPAARGLRAEHARRGGEL
ncbi:MAG: hypothetical protein M3518_03985 [Actinomycetota bacterium]|nr:hypothetical protein [Actinomycetota bacterium]